MDTLIPGIPWYWLIGLMLTALVAGYMDAIAGGGGLIQMPLLLLSGLSPLNVLATNKAIALTGTASATLRYMMDGQVAWRVVRVAALPCMLAAFLGSQLAMHTPGWLLELALLGCLVAALLVALLVRPGGELHNGPAASRLRIITSLAPVGLYDGFSGPGTGLFLTLVKHARLHLGLLVATATTKPLNLLTNLGGVVAFIWAGTVVWELALPMIMANMLGGWLGSRAAIRNGARLIRPVLLGMLALLCTMTLGKFIHALP